MQSRALGGKQHVKGTGKLPVDVHGRWRGLKLRRHIQEGPLFLP